ncbi:uracil-DNA glycosylase [Piscinibacter koreensis]|uniref:Type-4 uracil-DNA glycosylase n=1 Tax=Piscinibacter koreensis TaxID=2742824 RepID=A0A7Y6NNR4_9BURK|nr:uracil-DNA glycosylase [Schlegelella koreensis]NUZ06457.1 uracil-DNA glycosylase [Schlegelella koreensis]
MRWTERQRAMLAEMGVRLWLPEATVGGEAGVDALDGAAGALGGVPDARARGAESTSGGSPARTREGAEARLLPGASGAASEPRPGPSPALPGTGRTVAAPAAVAGVPPATPFMPAADAAERAAAIATLDWGGLRASAAACTACPLCEGRTHSVFASAAGSADWLVVTDPPGPDDDATGAPMSGAPGRLLDNMLRAVRHSRADTALPAQRASVVPIVKCRPPGDRSPSAVEIEACRPYLERQIELVRPNVIVAMGRFAAPGLLRRNEPLGALRGRVHDAAVPVVATFHPAHLLRHGDDKAKAWDDLCRASAAAAMRASVTSGDAT